MSSTESDASGAEGGATVLDDGSSSSRGAETTSSDASSSSTGDDAILGDEALARIRDAVESTLGQGYATGCSVAIWRDGAVVYAEGFGKKDAADRPVTPETLFQIGSDTKKLTAIGLLRHVDAGAIELDSTVGELLPSLDLTASPGAFAELSIHALLSHQSGLFDYTPWDDAPDDAELQLRTSTRFATNEYAMMPPGVAWNYSNPNFALAGVLIEVLTERPWADVIMEDVVTPLGLIHTYARRDDMLAQESDIASGFGPLYDANLDTFDLLEQLSFGATTEGWTTPEEQVDNAFIRPAGLVWSTASDMATLGGFLITGDPAVLSDVLRERMQTGQVGLAPNVEPDALGYGYGLMTQGGFGGTQGWFDVPVLAHGGNTLSMTSTFAVLPEQGIAVSVLSNGAGDDMNLVLAVAIEEAARDRLPAPGTPPQWFEPPAGDLSVYAGSFGDRALGTATLSWSGDELTIDVPLLTELGVPVMPVLQPVYRDGFVLTVGNAPMTIDFYPALDGTAHAYAVDRLFVFARAAAEGRRVSEARGPVRLDRLRPLAGPTFTALSPFVVDR